MRKIFTTLFVVCLCLPGIAQQTLQTHPDGSAFHQGQVNEKGLLTGEQTYFRPDGSLEAKVWYDANGYAQRAETYRQSGNLEDEVEYRQPKVRGTYLDSSFYPIREQMLDTLGVRVAWLQHGDASGALPKAQEQKIWVHYQGFLLSGNQFDSSLGRRRPFSFITGRQEVVPGFERAVSLMREGDIILVEIPPALAYQGYALEGIPPYSTIVFRIERVKMN